MLHANDTTSARTVRHAVRGRRKRIAFLTALLLTAAMTGCEETETQSSGTPAETQAATRPDIPEGAITDASGEFYYDGKLQQIGDAENGYIQVPLGYLPFQDEDVEGLTQYCDASGKNIITLDFYDNISYQVAAEGLRSYMQQDETLEDVSGAMVTVAGYNALQLYGHYTDGYFIVAWLIEDPADPADSYYLAMEFDSDHQYLIACSSTFQTREDYQPAEETT